MAGILVANRNLLYGGAACLALTFWCLMIIAHLIAIFYAQRHLHSRRSRTVDKNDPMKHLVGIGLDPVSIIRPISSDSENIISNLETLFQLEYHKFELLICVQDSMSELIPLIGSLIEKYPEVDATLLCGALNVGVNPKINNMMQAYPAAKYNLIWISDSGIRVHKKILEELVSHFKDDVAIVHQLPFVADMPGLAACVEKVYFGTQHARWYLIANFLGFCCVNGMSSLVDKQLLEKVGGLKCFSEYIAEDYFMSTALYKQGYKMVLSTEPAIQNPESYSIINFMARMVRWAQLRLTMEPLSFIEPITEALLVGLFGSASVWYLFALPFYLVYIAHVCMWLTLDQILLYLVQGSCSRLPPLHLRVLAWLLRELITYYVIVRAVWSKQISWRAGTFRLTFGGRAKFIEPKSH